MKSADSSGVNTLAATKYARCALRLVSPSQAEGREGRVATIDPSQFLGGTSHVVPALLGLEQERCAIRDSDPPKKPFVPMRGDGRERYHASNTGTRPAGEGIQSHRNQYVPRQEQGGRRPVPSSPRYDREGSSPTFERGGSSSRRPVPSSPRYDREGSSPIFERGGSSSRRHVPSSPRYDREGSSPTFERGGSSSSRFERGGNSYDSFDEKSYGERSYGYYASDVESGYGRDDGSPRRDSEVVIEMRTIREHERSSRDHVHPDLKGHDYRRDPRRNQQKHFDGYDDSSGKSSRRGRGFSRDQYMDGNRNWLAEGMRGREMRAITGDHRARGENGHNSMLERKMGANAGGHRAGGDERHKRANAGGHRAVGGDRHNRANAGGHRAGDGDRHNRWLEELRIEQEIYGHSPMGSQRGGVRMLNARAESYIIEKAQYEKIRRVAWATFIISIIATPINPVTFALGCIAGYQTLFRNNQRSLSSDVQFIRDVSRISAAFAFISGITALACGLSGYSRTCANRLDTELSWCQTLEKLYIALCVWGGLTQIPLSITSFILALRVGKWNPKRRETSVESKPGRPVARLNHACEYAPNRHLPNQTSHRPIGSPTNNNPFLSQAGNRRKSSSDSVLFFESDDDPQDVGFDEAYRQAASELYI